MDGVAWGTPYAIPSAAFWALLVAENAGDLRFQPRRVGNSLLEQTAFCLLGGYGMPAEMGTAAFHLLRGAGLLKAGASADCIEAYLSRPLRFGGRTCRYRFPRQKARYLATILDTLSERTPPVSPLRLREFLRSLPGIGYKTASWIVRDWLSSDDVAIIDVHIDRACRAIGVFLPAHRVVQDYLAMEQRFLELARQLRSRPSVLDGLMWSVMRKEGGVLGVA